MSNKPKLTQEEVIVWLVRHMPALSKYAEPDRSWVWLAVNLKGCGKSRRDKPCPCQKCAGMSAIREKIKSVGFEFSKRGHSLPSGRTGMWFNPCDGPRPFRPFFRRDKDAKRKTAPVQKAPVLQEAQQNPAPSEPVVVVDPEFMADSAGLFENF